MNWYFDLYLGEKAEKKKDDLIRKIKNGKTAVNTYVLTLPANNTNQLEILAAGELDFWYDKLQQPMIVGLACGKKEARALVVRITKDVLQETGGTGIRDYFLAKSRE
jgi:hypothetical protein